MKKLSCFFYSIIFMIIMMSVPCAETPEKILYALKEKMSPWVKLPPDHLTSLQYNLDINGVSKHIELDKMTRRNGNLLFRKKRYAFPVLSILSKPWLGARR
jgi:hypothetical protein